MCWRLYQVKPIGFYGFDLLEQRVITHLNNTHALKYIASKGNSQRVIHRQVLQTHVSVTLRVIPRQGIHARVPSLFT